VYVVRGIVPSRKNKLLSDSLPSGMHIDIVELNFYFQEEEQWQKTH
jgi:hypothetical protein